MVLFCDCWSVRYGDNVYPMPVNVVPYKRYTSLTIFSSYFLFSFVTIPVPGVESDAANKVMDLVRERFVSGDLSAVEDDDSGITLVGAEEFA